MAMAKKFTSMRSDIRKQAATRSVGGGTKFMLPEGVNFFNPKKGTTRLSIVPYTVSINKHPAGRDIGDMWFERRYSVHFNIGAETKSYVCPKSVGQRCPICEYRIKLAKSQNPDEDAVKELKAKDRVLYNVKDEDDSDDNVMLWDVSFYNFTKKLEEEITEGPDEYGDFPAPDETGMVLSVRFSEKTMGKNTYLEASRIDFKERGEDLADTVLESALDLDKILKVLPYDELEAIFLELDSASSEKEDDKKEEPQERKSKQDKKETKSKSEEKQNSDDEAADAEAAEKARKEKIRAAKKAEVEAAKKAAEEATRKAAGGDECPAGGVFGKDTDELPECDACIKWDACIAKKEG